MAIAITEVIRTREQNSIQKESGLFKASIVYRTIKQFLPLLPPTFHRGIPWRELYASPGPDKSEHYTFFVVTNLDDKDRNLLYPEEWMKFSCWDHNLLESHLAVIEYPGWGETAFPRGLSINEYHSPTSRTCSNAVLFPTGDVQIKHPNSYLGLPEYNLLKELELNRLSVAARALKEGRVRPWVQEDINALTRD